MTYSESIVNDHYGGGRRLLGVSTRSGFPVFGQNREPEPGYPGSLFWETGTGTGITRPVPVLPGPVTDFKKKKKKNFLGLYIGSF
jgi:hypothetical protein